MAPGEEKGEPRQWVPGARKPEIYRQLFVAFAQLQLAGLKPPFKVEELRLVAAHPGGPLMSESACVKAKRRLVARAGRSTPGKRTPEERVAKALEESPLELLRSQSPSSFQRVVGKMVEFGWAERPVDGHYRLSRTTNLSEQVGPVEAGHPLTKPPRTLDRQMDQPTVEEALFVKRTVAYGVREVHHDFEKQLLATCDQWLQLVAAALGVVQGRGGHWPMDEEFTLAVRARSAAIVEPSAGLISDDEYRNWATNLNDYLATGIREFQDAVIAIQAIAVERLPKDDP